MTLNEAINEVLKHAPALKKIEIIPMALRSNNHIVIADGILIQDIHGPAIGESIKIPASLLATQETHE